MPGLAFASTPQSLFKVPSNGGHKALNGGPSGASTLVLEDTQRFKFVEMSAAKFHAMKLEFQDFFSGREGNSRRGLAVV